METITFQYGLFEVTMNVAEVSKMYEDIHFLEDAILSVLKPDVKSDLPFTPEKYREYLKDYFLKETNTSKEFVEKVFN